MLQKKKSNLLIYSLVLTPKCEIGIITPMILILTKENSLKILPENVERFLTVSKDNTFIFCAMSLSSKYRWFLFGFNSTVGN
jgi:hypothetical protein